MIARSVVLTLTCLVGGAAPGAGQTSQHEPVIGGPCEGCEAVFQGLPAELSSAARIAPRDEPGEPMRIEGRVLRPDGTAAPGTIVYAYQTNAEGVYPRDPALRGQAAYRHGRLRGWARADARGRYRFDTVRPAGYPGSSIPQHVHLHVIEPGCCTYYIDDIVFTDDPRLTPDEVGRYDHGRGGSGVVTPWRDEDGTWIVERDIVLGRGIPGHPSWGASTEPSESEAASRPELRAELLEMAQADQAVRQELIAAGVARPDERLLAEMRAIDEANVARLKEIVRRHGWPSAARVGEEGSDAAFLIVQHADPATQSEMLPLVEAAYREGDLSGESYALLLDRVLVGRGEPQVYGTQIVPIEQWQNGEPVTYPIADEERVDERRQSVGLPPLAEYLELARELYSPREAAEG